MSGKLEHRRNAPRRLVETREERDSRLSIQFCQQMDPFAGDFRISSRDFVEERSYRSLYTRRGNLVDRCPLEGRADPNVPNKLASLEQESSESFRALRRGPLIGLLDCAVWYSTLSSGQDLENN